MNCSVRIVFVLDRRMADHRARMSEEELKDHRARDRASKLRKRILNPKRVIYSDRIVDALYDLYLPPDTPATLWANPQRQGYVRHLLHLALTDKDGESS